MKTIAIIAAGGQGKRIIATDAERKLPKQFLMLRDKPVLAHTVEKF